MVYLTGGAVRLRLMTPQARANAGRWSRAASAVTLFFGECGVEV